MPVADIVAGKRLKAGGRPQEKPYVNWLHLYMTTIMDCNFQKEINVGLLQWDADMGPCTGPQLPQ